MASGFASSDDDLAVVLIQMKSQVLDGISEGARRVRRRVRSGRRLAEAIAPSRLRALPFEVRCKDCAETHEQSDHELPFRWSVLR